jgi:hypothetical protein
MNIVLRGAGYRQRAGNREVLVRAQHLKDSANTLERAAEALVLKSTSVYSCAPMCTPGLSSGY